MFRDPHVLERVEGFQDDHGMAVPDELLDQVSTDEARAGGAENAQISGQIHPKKNCPNVGWIATHKSLAVNGREDGNT